MFDNQRGGILSKIFIIPIAVAMMTGFFFLGYYVGKYQSKTNKDQIVVPVPESVSDDVPKSDDFTFFKTLSDKNGKSVSIDLKPAQNTTEKKAEDSQPANKTAQPQKEKAVARESETAKTAQPKETVQKQQTAKKELPSQPSSKARYTLQLASYQDREMAEQDVKKMKQLGYAAYIVSSQLQGKGTWYRVRLGSFTKKAYAEKLQKELKTKHGATTFIMTD